MPLPFNAVKLYVVTINGKPWARAREVCRALEYGKATKVADIAKHLSNRENYAHKCQFNEFASETNLDLPKDSRKGDYYVNEGGMYEVVFSSQQSDKRPQKTLLQCVVSSCSTAAYKQNEGGP